jgi:hypothetical protein
VHRVTLDQLDEAFQAGHIDEETMVLAEGAERWVALGRLAGLDEEAESPSAEGASAQPAAPQWGPATSYRSMQQTAPAPYFQPSQTPPSTTLRPASPVAVPGLPSGVQTVPGGMSYRPAPQVIAPYQQYAQHSPYGTLRGPASVPPASGSLRPQLPATTSFRPVSVDLSDVDTDDVPFRKRSGKKWVVTLTGFAAVAAIAAVATTQPRARAYVTSAQSFVNRVVLHRALPAAPPPAVAVAPPPVVPEPTPPAAAEPPPVAVIPATTPPPAASSAERFSTDTKQKLLDADKQRDVKAKARSHSAPAASHPSSRTKFSGFTSGGNKFDPLNSAIP